MTREEDEAKEIIEIKKKIYSSGVADGVAGCVKAIELVLNYSTNSISDKRILRIARNSILKMFKEFSKIS